MEEVWKDIRGYEGLYQVSNLGRVRSLERVITYIQTNQHDKIGKEVHQKLPGRMLSPRKLPSGYLRVQLMNKDYYIHRLVCSNFIRPLKPKEEINHKDGNKQNNQIDNLEIVDRVTNHNHACNTGLNTYIHKAQDVIFNGKLYHSLGEIERETGIGINALLNHLQNPNTRFKKYEPFTIKYASVETNGDECSQVGQRLALVETVGSNIKEKR